MGIKQKLIGISKEGYASIERRLNGVLKPVKPRKGFVSGVRKKIKVAYQPAQGGHVTNTQFILILLAGLVSLVVLVVMSVRALISLFQKKAVRRQPRRRTQKMTNASPSSV